MRRVIGIGQQDFGDIRRENLFYVDKTAFIREWWENRDCVTLITRPRRFGKTLTMSMLEYFFSVKHAKESKIFEGLKIWEDEKYHKIQGTWPVISLSFANVKEPTYEMAKKRICQLLTDIYNKNQFLLESGLLTDEETAYFKRITTEMDEIDATMALHRMSDFLSRYYRKKVIILLDEYDTPMQEAYIEGYWERLVSFTRSLFNASFKTNPFLERAIMTGITRVSKESVFSVGGISDIYNPWSILNYLKTGKIASYWTNTSSNRFVGSLIRESGRNLKMDFENLLKGGMLRTMLDEQVVFSQLDHSETAIWSMLLASGYLKIADHETDTRTGREYYTLALTNREVQLMFENIVHDWFAEGAEDYNDFIKGLLSGDVEAMNCYMNRITKRMFSYFDTGKKQSDQEPERFYHGFVLGLIVELENKYQILSNRESGFGRYDVVLEPLDKKEKAFIIEFKVRNPKTERTLEDTVQTALGQIKEKEYAVGLENSGILKENICAYGIAFEGKKVLIGEA